MLRIADCIARCIRLAVPQPTEWQHIGDEIDAAMIRARADCVKRASRLDWSAAGLTKISVSLNACSAARTEIGW